VFERRSTPTLAFRFTRADGKWTLAREERPLETRVVEIAGTAGPSLFDAVKRAGESPTLAVTLADLIAGELNPYVDLQPGDRWKLIVEKRFLGGKFWRYGRVLAAEWAAAGGRVWRAFWFQPKDGTSGGYFTEHGEGAARVLLRTPLKLVRLPPGEQRHRLHPLARIDHGVAGVDFPAPAATPVAALGAGRVTFVGPRVSGMAVVVQHTGGYESSYAHLSRVSRGLAVGQEVRTSQVIGWVAPAALPAGPYVHVSVRYNGAAIDPLKLKAPRTAPLSPRHRIEFADSITPRIQSLAALEAR
jgi:murein DD-endopeptidase MepM/ murein hydrolase activator NlpD